MINQAYAYTIDNPAGSFKNLGDVIGTILPNIFIGAGLLTFALLIIGGFKYLTAGGDEKAVMSAKDSITNAIIGLVIIFCSYWIMWIIQTIFGLDFGFGNFYV
ncbi:MAG: hypothetical protein ACOC4Z_02110 [Patescibacteria group bacterium]